MKKGVYMKSFKKFIAINLCLPAMLCSSCYAGQGWDNSVANAGENYANKEYATDALQFYVDAGIPERLLDTTEGRQSVIRFLNPPQAGYTSATCLVDRYLHHKDNGTLDQLRTSVSSYIGSKQSFQDIKYQDQSQVYHHLCRLFKCKLNYTQLSNVAKALVVSKVVEPYSACTVRDLINIVKWYENNWGPIKQFIDHNPNFPSACQDFLSRPTPPIVYPDGFSNLNGKQVYIEGSQVYQHLCYLSGKENFSLKDIKALANELLDLWRTVHPNIAFPQKPPARSGLIDMIKWYEEHWDVIRPVIENPSNQNCLIQKGIFQIETDKFEYLDQTFLSRSTPPVVYRTDIPNIQSKRRYMEKSRVYQCLCLLSGKNKFGVKDMQALANELPGLWRTVHPEIAPPPQPANDIRLIGMIKWYEDHWVVIEPVIRNSSNINCLILKKIFQLPSITKMPFPMHNSNLNPVKT